MMPFNRFKQIIAHFDTQTKCEEVLSSAQNYYFLKPYKIRKINCEQAINIFLSLQRKYQIKQLQYQPLNWHKNQRKVYIWFLICYCQIKCTLPDKMNIDEWNYLGTIFHTKDTLLLVYQGLSILKNEGKKIWTVEEDEILVKFVKQIGQGNWNQISKAIFFNQRCQRFITPKQCRQRWYNHKNQYIIKGQWSIQQDYKLLYYCLHHDKSWCKIVKVLNNTRTQHMIKNRFYCLLKKANKHNLKTEIQKIQFWLKNIQQKIDLQNLSQDLKINNDVLIQDNKEINLYKNQKFPKTQNKKKFQTQICHNNCSQISFFPPTLSQFLPKAPFLGYILPIPTSTLSNNKFEPSQIIQRDTKRGFTLCQSQSTHRFIQKSKQALKTRQTEFFSVKQQQYSNKTLKKEVITLQKYY